MKNSFYLHDMDDEDLPASLVAPLSSIVDVDPTEKVSDYRGLLFYGGFFDPRNINKKGIAPFTNAINNFNNASYKDMGVIFKVRNLGESMAQSMKIRYILVL